MNLEAQALDGTMTGLATHLFTTPTDADSFTFIGTASLAKVQALQVTVASALTVSTQWLKVTDTYPTQAASVTVTSIGRDGPTGNLTANASGSLTGGELIDGVCPSTDSACIMTLQAQGSDGSTITNLAVFTMPGTITSSYSHPFVTSTHVDKVLAVRVEVQGGHQKIDSPWVAVADPIVSASVSASISSVAWDAPSESDSFDVTGTIANSNSSDADCASSGTACSMTLEAQGPDGTVIGMATYVMPINPGAGYSHQFVGSAFAGQIDSVRVRVQGASRQTVGSWLPVSVAYPTASAAIGSGTYGRDSSSGNFTFNVVGSAANFASPVQVCGNFASGCTLLLQGEDADGNPVTLASQSVGSVASPISYSFAGSSPNATKHLTNVRVIVRGTRGTVASNWSAVTDPHSDPASPGGSVSASVTSVGRSASTGVFSYDITGTAVGAGGPSAACDTTFYSTCSLTLMAQFADGTSRSLNGVSFGPGAGSYSHEFIDSTASIPIVAVQANLAGGNGVVYGAWVSITDPYPTPSISVSVSSLGRDPATGNLTFSASASASNYWLPDGPCSDSGSGCTMFFQAREIDGTFVSLGSATSLYGSTYPYSTSFSGPRTVPQITAVRAEIVGYSQLYSSWTTVTDPYPTTTATTTVNSIGRDASTGNLTYNIGASASGYDLPGAVCETASNCVMTLQARGLDGSIYGFDNATSLPATYPYTKVFTSAAVSSTRLPQINAVRVTVQGGNAGNYFSAWTTVTDHYPVIAGSVQVTKWKRDTSGNSLTFGLTGSASNYWIPNNVCDPASNCSMYAQVQESDGTVVNLGSTSYIEGQNYPYTHPFTGTVSLPQVVAVRVAVYGYTSVFLSAWQTVNDPWVAEDQPINPAEKKCGCQGGDPVQTATGEFDQSSTDLAIAGAGPSLSIARSYSSTNTTQTGPFGYGWSADFEAALNVLQAGDSVDPLPRVVSVTQENGSTVQFTEQTNHTYAAPSRVFATLTYNSTTQLWTFTRNAISVMTFNSTGQLAAFNDLNGNAVTVGYTSGNVTSLSASGGRVINLTWTSGHVTGLTDSAGRTVSYGYDGSGNLTTVNAIDGSATTYGYDSGHYLTTITAPRGGVLTNVYDTQHRVTSQTDALGRQTTFAYTDTDTTTTNPDGSQTVDTYNQGRAVSQTMDAGTAFAATTSWTYDASNNRLSETDPLGKVSTATYDSNGNILVATDPLGHKTTSTYNALNEPLTVTDPLGRKTTYTYDSAGNRLSATSPTGRVQHWTYNSNGTVATAVDGRGQTTTLSYNTAGDPTGSSDPDSRTTAVGYNSAGFVTSKTDGAGHSTTDTVDAAGRVLTSTDPNSHTTTFTYDLDGNQTSVTDPNAHSSSKTYDLAGQVTSSTDARGKITSYTYTPGGQLATTTDPDGHVTTNAYNLLRELTSVTDANSHVTTHTYDADGRKLTTTLPSGDQSSTVYDAAGHATSTKDAKGKITTMVYDADGEVTSSKDPLARNTQTSYTGDGQPLTITLPNTSTETYVYNADGQPTQFTNADGKITTYVYDNADLLTSKVEPGGLTTGYSYDAAGRLSITTNPDTSTMTDSYDNAGKTTRVHSSTTGSTDITYAYDPAGQRLTMTDQTGTTSYTYNADGQLSTVTNGASATIGYGYDNAGLMTSIVYPGSKTVTYAYDPVGQMTSLTDWSSNQTTFAWTVDGKLLTQTDPNGVTETRTYDADNQTTGIKDVHAGTTLANYTYGYDNAGNTSSDGTTDPIGTVAHTYAYDTNSQLTTVTKSGVSTSYHASSAGQLTADTAGNTLAYNTAQELTSLTPATAAASTYAYDSNGSRTSSTVAAHGTTPAATTTYAFDTEQHLAAVTLPGATVPSVSYTTDGDGLRETRTAGPTTTNFLWDRSGSLPLLLDDGTDKYIYGPSSAPIAQVDDVTGTTQYLHGDRIGSTRLITNSTGTVAGTTEYDPYGNRTNHTGTADSAIGYSGNWTDTTSGLVYLRARDYDPATTQFLTVDPAVDTTRQPYAYVANDPLDNSDPTGLNCGGLPPQYTHTPGEYMGGFWDQWNYDTNTGPFTRMDMAGFNDGSLYGIPALFNNDTTKYGGDASYWIEYGLGVTVATASAAIGAAAKVAQAALGAAGANGLRVAAPVAGVGAAGGIEKGAAAGWQGGTLLPSGQTVFQVGGGIWGHGLPSIESFSGLSSSELMGLASKQDAEALRAMYMGATSRIGSNATAPVRVQILNLIIKAYGAQK